MTNKNFLSEANESAASERETTVIPVIEESILVGKKIEETATVKISKDVSETNEVVNVNLLSDEYLVEHIPINKYADNDDVPMARHEGDTFIIPVMREVLVKRLLVVEEIRITKQTVERNEQHNVRLRKELVTVVRTAKTEVK